jgi:hypothetical protein
VSPPKAERLARWWWLGYRHGYIREAIRSPRWTRADEITAYRQGYRCGWCTHAAEATRAVNAQHVLHA